MTYKELNKVIELLETNGYMKKTKPIWDMDMYQILNTVNKNIETTEQI